MFGLRRDVEEKLARLPLRYFDSHPHGDILSRVTNDIDNLTTTLQQGLSQLLTSVLTVVGVHGDDVLDLAAARRGVAARRSRSRSSSRMTIVRAFAGPVRRPVGAHRHAQRPRRGDAHRPCARADLRAPRATVDEFGRQNQQPLRGELPGQFLSGIIQPAMMFLANINYVAIAVLGGWRVASGALSLGDVQAFIQYSRQFTMPITQIASQMNMLQSGLASAERVFEFLDAAEEAPDLPAAAAAEHRNGGRVTLDDVSLPLRAGQAADRGLHARRRGR